MNNTTVKQFFHINRAALRIDEPSRLKFPGLKLEIYISELRDAIETFFGIGIYKASSIILFGDHYFPNKKMVKNMLNIEGRYPYFRFMIICEPGEGTLIDHIHTRTRAYGKYITGSRCRRGKIDVDLFMMSIADFGVKHAEDNHLIKNVLETGIPICGNREFPFTFSTSRTSYWERTDLVIS